MLVDEVNLHPIQIVVNYWEARSGQGVTDPSARKHTSLAERLDHLVRSGVTHIATFAPWQAVESDISHALPRFLQAVAERKLHLSLIVTPEVGVHYTNSGLPKDLISQPEDMARNVEGEPVVVQLPPTSFALPSLFSANFHKRYTSFLSKMDSLFGDLGKTDPEYVENVTLILTGSFWKYYRSPRNSARYAFGGLGGDYSECASLEFRQRVEQFFEQKEFTEENPLSSTGWKNLEMDEINRRWFYQYAENVFRSRTLQLVTKKSPFLETAEMELYTPEADPGFMYSHFLQTLSGGRADVSRLSSLLDELSSRTSSGSQGIPAPYIHWSGLGGFGMLSDPEKQFLILKSLLLMGGRSGGILVDETDWLTLSRSFRKRAENIGLTLATGRLAIRNKAFYLTPHLWSSMPHSAGATWEELREQTDFSAQMVTSIHTIADDKAKNDGQAKLLIVDPSFILLREHVSKLLLWARSGRIVALPRSNLYTEAARAIVEELVANTPKIEVSLGLTYSLHRVGKGQIIIYEELPEDSQEAKAGIHNFISAMLALAEIETHCSLSDSRLTCVPMKTANNKACLFILNSCRALVKADVIFSNSMEISDIGGMFRANPEQSLGSTSGGGRVPQEILKESFEEIPLGLSERFGFEIAAFGIFSLGIAPARHVDVEPRIASADLGAPLHNDELVFEAPASNLDLKIPVSEPMSEKEEPPWN